MAKDNFEEIAETFALSLCPARPPTALTKGFAEMMLMFVKHLEGRGLIQRKQTFRTKAANRFMKIDLKQEQT